MAAVSKQAGTQRATVRITRTIPCRRTLSTAAEPPGTAFCPAALLHPADRLPPAHRSKAAAAKAGTATARTAPNHPLQAQQDFLQVEALSAKREQLARDSQQISQQIAQSKRLSQLQQSLVQEQQQLEKAKRSVVLCRLLLQRAEQNASCQQLQKPSSCTSRWRCCISS